jgi:hypothetical protein
MPPALYCFVYCQSIKTAGNTWPVCMLTWFLLLVADANARPQPVWQQDSNTVKVKSIFPLSKGTESSPNKVMLANNERSVIYFNYTSQ